MTSFSSPPEATPYTRNVAGTSIPQMTTNRATGPAGFTLVVTKFPCAGSTRASSWWKASLDTGPKTTRGKSSWSALRDLPFRVPLKERPLIVGLPWRLNKDKVKKDDFLFPLKLQRSNLISKKRKSR